MRFANLRFDAASLRKTHVRMLIFQKVTDLQCWLNSRREAGERVGFAPTMGALHQGHLDLIRLAKNDDTLAVASIFVNPTQFNDPKDLEKYPRMPEKDIPLLIQAGCDVLFMPTVEDVYPPGVEFTVKLDFGQLDEVMEGVFRPGHFLGMATVVNRLLNIVQPDRLYMGQKDYQQLSIVRDMLRQLHSPVELVMCPTRRESDGLAMSSRNMRLTPDMRATAPVIYQTLQWASEAYNGANAEAVGAEAMQKLAAAGLKPEYFDLVDGISLLPATPDSKMVVACVAAWAGDVRLIDNIVVG